MIVEIYRRLAMAFNGARCRWAAYVRARSALIIGARGHAKARRHGGDEPSAFRTPGCRSSAAVRSCADPPERVPHDNHVDYRVGGHLTLDSTPKAERGRGHGSRRALRLRRRQHDRLLFRRLAQAWR